MRIALVVHGFPPHEKTGVENYTASLARALARAGHRVEVFAPRRLERLPELSLRREEGDGYGVTWVTVNRGPRGPEEALDPPGVAQRFAEFLDLERPEVVHFQHVLKLGLGLVEAARERGVPVLLTAHDYYGVCHRFTRLRPDLSRCEVHGDPAACARCDLGLGYLNGFAEELGDYHMGILPDQLDAERRDALARLLAGDPGAIGVEEPEWEAALERRRALDERRREVFTRFDRVLAPTRYLARDLVAGGLDEDRVRHLPYGIDTAELTPLRDVARDPGEPLRIGYFGSLTKHKGVDVLLEAFGRLEEPAELLVWGDSTDRVYVRRVRELATRVGARLLGSYESDELPACLAEVDVVVVPSVWVENYPIVIREAFAAGRPVLVSRLGALPESVRDGVDGLHFEPGDAEDLARALGRLLREEGLLERLRAGIGAVHDLADQVRELETVYAELVAEARARRDETPLPAHLADVAARHAELAGLPTRDLFRRAVEGLGRLRTGLFGGRDPGLDELVSRALGTGSKAQILLSDLGHSEKWLKETVAGQAQAERALEERARWREEELEGVRRELAWVRGERDALERERDYLKSEVAGRDEELVWLREAKAELEEQKAVLAEIEAMMQEAMEDLRHQLAASAQQAQERLSTTAELGLEALRAQEATFGREIAPLLRAVNDLLQHEGEDAELRSLGSIVAATRHTHDLVRVLAEEIRWRRVEMARAIEESRRTMVSLLVSRTGLGRRVARWGGSEGEVRR